MTDPNSPNDDQNPNAGQPPVPPTPPVPPVPPQGEQPVPPVPPVVPTPENPAPVHTAPQGGYAPQGAPAPQGDPAQNPYAAPQNPYAPAPGAKSGFPKWAWWVIGGAVALIIVIIAAIVLFVSILGAGNGAKGVAEQYLNDIAKGDAGAAAKLDRTESGDFLMTDAVLAKATKITSPKVTRTYTGRGSDQTQVQVTYKLKGKSYRDTIELDKDEKGWYVSKPLAYQLPYVSSTIPGFVVEGAKQPVTSEDSEVLAYPGVYTLTAPNKYYELKGSPELVVASGSYTDLKLDLTPSKEYLAEVQKQVDAHYADCATKTAYYDVEDCGIDLSYPSNMSVSQSTVAVTVVESPQVTVNDGSDSYYQFKIAGGSFTAVITGSDYRGNPATENLTGEAGYISADIAVKDGKVVVTFN